MMQNFQTAADKLNDLVGQLVELEDKRDELLLASAREAASSTTALTEEIERNDDAMEGVRELINSHIDTCLNISHRLSERNEDLDAEIKRLKERKESGEARNQELADAILGALRVTGRKKYSNNRFTVTVRGTAEKVVIDDEEAIPAGFFVIKPAKPQLDKKAVKKYLEQSEAEWGHLEPGSSMSIK